MKYRIIQNSDNDFHIEQEYQFTEGFLFRSKITTFRAVDELGRIAISFKGYRVNKVKHYETLKQANKAIERFKIYPKIIEL